MNTLRFARLASGLLALGAALDLSAQVVFTANGTYNQNFDTLPYTTNTSAQLTWDDNTTLTGWYSSDTSGYHSKIGDGGSPSHGLNLYMPEGNTDDRALGSYTNSNSSSVFFGVQLMNNTGHVLNSVSISFALENYRASSSAGDKLIASFGLNNSDLFSGSWDQLASLDYTNISNTLSLSSLSWNDGDSLWIRWEDTVFTEGTNPKNAGFGLDNFSVTAIPEPSTYALILGVATLGLVGFRRWRAQR